MNPLISHMTGTAPAIQNIANLKKMLTGQNQNMVFQALSRNPQFAQFVRENRGKSPQQIAQDYGLDWNAVQNILK